MKFYSGLGTFVKFLFFLSIIPLATILVYAAGLKAAIYIGHPSYYKP
jgi:hypothetical protein